MRGRAILLAPLLLVAAAAAALAQQPLRFPEAPELTVHIRPETAETRGVRVQGQVVISISLASRYPFDSLSLPLPEISDVELFQLAPNRTREVRAVGYRLAGGVNSGFLHEILVAVFPRASGVMTVPPIRAEGAISHPDRGTLDFETSSKPIEITVLQADPGFRGDWWVVADRVEIAERWSIPPEELAVGEVTRREVTLTAYGTTVERLPALQLSSGQGTAVVPAVSDSRNEATPDGFVAHRTASWDMEVLDKTVAYVGPIGLSYWDAQRDEQAAAFVRGRRIEPKAPDSARIAERLLADSQSERRQVQVVVALAAAVLALPVLVLSAAIAAALRPSAADGALKRALRRPVTPRSIRRIVDIWAQATAGCGIAALRPELSGPARDTLMALERCVFGRDDGAVDRAHLARTLCAESRRIRLARTAGAALRVLGRVFDPFAGAGQNRTRGSSRG